VYESESKKSLQQRRDKLQQIAALGQQNGLTYAEATYPTATPPPTPFPSCALPTTLSPPNSSNPRLIHRGLGRRPHHGDPRSGQAGFAQLQQGGQRFQIYVRKDDVGEDAFALYKLLDLGDHIGVRGHLFRTRTGELTVHVGPGGGKPAITFSPRPCSPCRQVPRPRRHGTPLPPALRRPLHEHGRNEAGSATAVPGAN